MNDANPIAVLVLSFIEAIKPLFTRISTNYDLHYTRRGRATNRLNRIYRLAIDIFVKLQNGLLRPIQPPRAPRPQPAPAPREPNRPRRPRRIAPVRVLAARLCRELDILAQDIGRIPEDIRILCDQILEALGITRQHIARRYEAARTRARQRAETAIVRTLPPAWKTLEL